MPSEEKSKGIFSDVVAHLAALFRHMLPGVIVVGGVCLAYPNCVRKVDLNVTGHLVVLGVLTVTVGNTWFALNRYGIHQLVDVVLYRLRLNGPAMGDRWRYLDDLSLYTYKSLRSEDVAWKAQEHVKFRASTVLLIFTLGETAMLFGSFHSAKSILNGHGGWIVPLGIGIFAVGIWQMIITRRIDYYVVYPPASGPASKGVPDQSQIVP